MTKVTTTPDPTEVEPGLFDKTRYDDKIVKPDARCKERGTMTDWIDAKWHPYFPPRCNRTLQHKGRHQTVNRKDGIVLAEWEPAGEDSTEGPE